MNFEEMQFVGSKRTILSVYPEPCEIVLDFGPTMKGGKTKYRIEGAPKGEYRTLVVQDAFQAVIDYAQCQHIGKFPMTAVPESAEKLARELVREWTSGAGTGQGQQPGILLCAGNEPTKAEIAHATAIQSACFEMLIHEADEHAAKHQWRNINEKHRIAAKWSGVHRVWVAEVGEMGKKECSHCFTQIDKRATVCPQCGRDQAATAPVTTATAQAVKPPAEKPFKTTAVPVVPLAPPLQSPAGAA